MKYKVLNNDHIFMEIRDGLFYARFKHDVIDATLAQKLMEQRISFVEENDLPMIIDGSGVKDMTKEARMILSSERANRYTVALAIIIRSPVNRVLANFFLRFQQPPYPLRLFKNIEDAQEWLKQYQSE